MELITLLSTPYSKYTVPDTKAVLFSFFFPLHARSKSMSSFRLNPWFSGTFCSVKQKVKKLSPLAGKTTSTEIKRIDSYGQLRSNREINHHGNGSSILKDPIRKMYETTYQKPIFTVRSKSTKSQMDCYRACYGVSLQ